MKYLNTYEGLFSKEKPKIPQSFIDKVIRALPCPHISSYTNENGTTSITCGDVILEIRLVFEKVLSKKYIIRKYISTNVIHVTVHPSRPHFQAMGLGRSVAIGGIRDYGVDLKDIDKIDVGVIVTAVTGMNTSIQLYSDREKGIEDFYVQYPQEEILDLTSDISDILGGTPNIEKGARGKGYRVTFNTPQIKSSRHENNERKYRSSDLLSQVISELNSLDKRLKDGYGLEMEFSIHNSFINIEIWKEDQ